MSLQNQQFAYEVRNRNYRLKKIHFSHTASIHFSSTKMCCCFLYQRDHSQLLIGCDWVIHANEMETVSRMAVVAAATVTNFSKTSTKDESYF